MIKRGQWTQMIATYIAPILVCALLQGRRRFGVPFSMYPSVIASMQPWKKTFIMCRGELMTLARGPSEG